MKYFDTAGYQEFTSLAHVLMQGEKLSREKWSSLMNLPGYRAVFRSITSRLLNAIAGLDEEVFQRCMIEAFSEQGSKSRGAILSTYSIRE